MYLLRLEFKFYSFTDVITHDFLQLFLNCTRCTTCATIRTTSSRSICGCLAKLSLLNAAGSRVSSRPSPKRDTRFVGLPAAVTLFLEFKRGCGTAVRWLSNGFRESRREAQRRVPSFLSRLDIMDNAVLAYTLFRRSLSATGCGTGTASLYNPHANID